MKSFYKPEAPGRLSEIWDDRIAEATETETKWMQWETATEQCDSWHLSRGKKSVLQMDCIASAGADFQVQNKSTN